jgi:hypothetical protein
MKRSTDASAAAASNQLTKREIFIEIPACPDLTIILRTLPVHPDVFLNLEAIDHAAVDGLKA